MGTPLSDTLYCCVLLTCPLHVSTCKYSNGEVQRATGIISALKYKVPRLPRRESGKDKYTTIWTFRGIMLLRMEQCRMKSLPLGDISLGKFASMNPDQKGHLQKLIIATKNLKWSSVQELLTLCGNPRPELLSMVCCFVGDQCFDSVDVDTIDVQAWDRVLNELKCEHGMMPHVAYVCKKMRGI